MEKPPNNLMNPTLRLRSAPRCLAKTRRGTECQCPAMRGRKRCRIHGGANPSAPVGNRNAYRHGMRSAKMIAMRDEMRALIAAAQDTINRLDD